MHKGMKKYLDALASSLEGPFGFWNAPSSYRMPLGDQDARRADWQNISNDFNTVGNDMRAVLRGLGIGRKRAQKQHNVKHTKENQP